MHLQQRCLVRHNYFPSSIEEQLHRWKLPGNGAHSRSSIGLLLYFECLSTFQPAVTLGENSSDSLVLWLSLNPGWRRWAGELNCSVCLSFPLFFSGIEQQLIVVILLIVLFQHQFSFSPPWSVWNCIWETFSQSLHLPRLGGAAVMAKGPISCPLSRCLSN